MKKMKWIAAVATACLLGNTAFAKTLDILWWSDGVEGEALRKIAEHYAKEKGNINFNIIEVAYSDIDTKLKTMIAGKKPPAISRIPHPVQYANFALPLNDYIDPEEFFDSLRSYYIIDETVYGIPSDVTANGLIYNKTLFDQAGIVPPLSEDEVWSWEEFEETIKKVVENSDARYGMVWDFTPHRFSTILYEYNGRIFSDDRKKTLVNTPQSIKALEKFVHLHDEGIIPPSVWLGSENPNALFRTGTVATHLSGNWMLNNYKEIENFQWGVTYLPKGERRSSVPGGKYIMALKNSGYEQEAKEFLAYFASQEVNAEYCLESLFISPRKDNEDLPYSIGKEMFDIFANELSVSSEYAGNDWSDYKVMPKASNMLKLSIVEALQKKYTPKQALQRLEKRIEREIKKAYR